MLIKFNPKNDPGSARTWDFDPGDVLASEAELIEKHFGQPWDAFVQHVNARSMKALKLLLWHLFRAEHPRNFANLKDVPDFRTGDISIRHSVAELDQQFETVKAMDLTDAERTAATAAYELERAAALALEGKPADTPPEVDPPGETATVPELPPTSEPSPTFVAATGSPSPTS